MVNIHDGRGVLYPARLPDFQRIVPPEELRDRVSWFWISRWDLAAGRVSRQELLPFPQMNLVVQPEGVTLSGPSSGASHRDLHGNGWAVAALLRPAAAVFLSGRVHSTPQLLLDQEVPYEADELHHELQTQHKLGSAAELNERCALQFSLWLDKYLPAANSADLLANEFLEYVSSDPTALRVDQVAQNLNFTIRSLQRLSQKYLGLPPLAVIRRFRLQEAAQQIREYPQMKLASLAADLGYTDQAHLSKDFRKVLGYPPAKYRDG